MKISNYDFSACLYDPNNAEFISLITAGIAEFKKFTKKHDGYDSVFKWIVCSYDKQSPLVKEIPDLMTRKGECAVTVGYHVDKDGSFDEATEQFLLGKNPQVNSLIVSYVSRFADPHYIMLVASWNLLLDHTHKLLSGKHDKDSYNVIKNITDDIGDLTRRVFSTGDHDESLSMKKLLYERVEQDRMKLNIESLVKYISDHGDLPSDFNPYGEEYIVEKLKFIGDGEGVPDEVV